MTLVLTRFGHFDADGRFSRHRRENVDAFRLQRRGDVVDERGDFFQLHARRGMQFVARDRRAFGDVAQLHFDVELRERLLHKPRALHQLLLRFGRHEVRFGKVQQIQRWQLIIADERSAGDGEGLFLRSNAFRRSWRGCINGSIRCCQRGLAVHRHHWFRDNRCFILRVFLSFQEHRPCSPLRSRFPWRKLLRLHREAEFLSAVRASVWFLLPWPAWPR